MPGSDIIVPTDPSPSRPITDTKKRTLPSDTTIIKDKFGLDKWSIPDSVKQHPYFVELAGRSMVSAIQELDQRMKERGDYHLISTKSAHSLFGREIQAGRLGMYSYKVSCLWRVQQVKLSWLCCPIADGGSHLASICTCRFSDGGSHLFSICPCRERQRAFSFKVEPAMRTNH